MRCLMLLTLCVAPNAGFADSCTARIAALFDGGALDPFVRPAHHYVSTTTGPDGSVKSVYRAEFVSPAHSVGWTEGNPMQVLIIGSDSWIRMSEDAAWMAAPNMVPADHVGFLRAQRDQMRANLSDAQCPGTADLDGETYQVFEYVTRTDATEASSGAWFGGRNRVYIDPETDRVMHWRVTEAVSSFAPETSADVQMIRYEYDETITLPRPDN